MIVMSHYASYDKMFGDFYQYLLSQEKGKMF